MLMPHFSPKLLLPKLASTPRLPIEESYTITSPLFYIKSLPNNPRQHSVDADAHILASSHVRWVAFIIICARKYSMNMLELNYQPNDNAGMFAGCWRNAVDDWWPMGGQ